jgi:uncharacterized membrane protein YebE (DUF533 family)
MRTGPGSEGSSGKGKKAGCLVCMLIGPEASRCLVGSIAVIAVLTGVCAGRVWRSFWRKPYIFY